MLGHGDKEDRMPTKISTFDGWCVVAIVAGDMKNVAVTADGSAWWWGGFDFDDLLPTRVCDVRAAL